MLPRLVTQGSPAQDIAKGQGRTATRNAAHPTVPKVGTLRGARSTLPKNFCRAEGFTDIQYLSDDPREVGTSKLVAAGAADLNMSFALSTLVSVEAGEPVVLLGGVHIGCYELFGTQLMHTVRDLRG